jgi:hypothetical protein
MWVHNYDTDTWKLWIVPHNSMKEERTFYRKVAEVASAHRADLGTIDISDAELVDVSHPAVKGLTDFLHAPDLGAIRFAGNTFNGFYLPDGIVLRSRS